MEVLLVAKFLSCHCIFWVRPPVGRNQSLFLATGVCRRYTPPGLRDSSSALGYSICRDGFNSGKSSGLVQSMSTHSPLIFLCICYSRLSILILLTHCASLSYPQARVRIGFLSSEAIVSWKVKLSPNSSPSLCDQHL